jgi:extracellular factor (EF) 3-hydroxypalmitic acid methyl ester biosynthesis protein
MFRDMPLTTANSVVETSAPPAPKPAVLVVDDEKAQRDLLSAVLSPICCVDTAASVAEAVVKAELTPPALVIMDYAMPAATGIDGLHRLREIYPKLPVMILTGHADLGVAREAIRLGAVEYVLKPFEPTDLMTLVSRLTKGSKQSAPPLADVPYSVQRRLTAHIDLWRSRLPTIPSENRLTATVGPDRKVEAKVLRLGRDAVQAEVYEPSFWMEADQPLTSLQVWIGAELAYDGAGRVGSVISTGPSSICEFTLQKGWTEQPATPLGGHRQSAVAAARDFAGRWREKERLTPAFRQSVSEIQHLLSEMKDWLGTMEFSLRTEAADGSQVEKDRLLEQLLAEIEPDLTAAFDTFELESAKIAPDLVGLHAEHVRSRLHPLMLASPFVHRSFTKPLSYPGDYEVMNFMLGNPFVGGTVYAEVLNAFVVGRGAPAAYRHRVDYLERVLRREIAAAMKRNDRPCRILSLGCGAAPEVRRIAGTLSDETRAEFNLLDFSATTLKYAREELNRARGAGKPGLKIELREFSVQQMLARGLRMMNGRTRKSQDALERDSFDLVYCAGLFDSLSDRVCERLLQVFWQLASPGGRILATNFAPENPDKAFMDYILDWRLIYRDTEKMKLISDNAGLGPDLQMAIAPRNAEIFIESVK